jgi:hypothetical protein
MAMGSCPDENDLFEKYRILFRPPASDESELPTHHARSFQKILDLGSIRFQRYPHDDDWSEFWRAETKGRAQYLVDTASKLARKNASEMQWRLELEKIVYKRFELEIDWCVMYPVL